MPMKYITEYIPIVNGKVKLNFVPSFIEETLSYALLNDSFELFNENYQQAIPYNGNIVKIDNSFYLVFTLDEDLESFSNVSVTYGVDDGLSAAIDELKELLQVSDPSIDDYALIIQEFKDAKFIENDYAEPIFLPTYISSKIQFLATQYKQSFRLKALVLAHLEALEKPFMQINNIKDILDLEKAEGRNLELIGKIVGVNRIYCGDFENINYEFQSVASSKVKEIILEDDCLRKLIKIKIIKNNKKIVNLKTLELIIQEFFGYKIEIKTTLEFNLFLDVGTLEKQKLECLILLRAFLPLPSTIKVFFTGDIVLRIKDKGKIGTRNQQEACISLKKVITIQNGERLLIESIQETTAIEVLTYVQKRNRTRIELKDSSSVSSNTKQILKTGIT